MSDTLKQLWWAIQMLAAALMGLYGALLLWKFFTHPYPSSTDLWLGLGLMIISALEEINLQGKKSQ